MSIEVIKIKAAEGLPICHLIDEGRIYPECITRGDSPSNKNRLIYRPH
jgi:hypothetical protein